MLKKCLIALAVLAVALVGLCVVIGLQPSTFTVERSTTIAAPPAAVFPHVNDVRAWDAWSPWSKLDPNAEMTISTPSAGRGASIAWNGNDQIGEGTMVILESRPDELVELEQSFVRPMEGKARIAFALAPAGDQTNVTVKMTGENGFLGKAICLFMDLDAMLGKEFEQALANLKGVVEKPAAEAAETKEGAAEKK
jgi:uncharacterized protein YndB with AHSA1/START domain